ncbi:MAG TPA: hypothetical protein VHE61_09470 [Opitutaceae bacterium]|nr:hypothetical protein [Opitutaceae bacterium]
MKALLICPGERPGASHLATATPLAAAPVLGRPLIEYWIEDLVARRATQVTILACDRPGTLRRLLGDGSRWGIQIELVPTPREPGVDETRAKYRTTEADGWLAEADVTVIDHLPGRADLPLFDSYAGWFAAVRAWIPHAATAGRVGPRETSPGIWVGLRAEIAPSARLAAPCWIGDFVQIGPDAEIGPGAIIDAGVVVERAARVRESVVESDTYVGEFVLVQNSIARGSLLLNWQTGSSVDVPDAFLLSHVGTRRRSAARPSLPGRLAALVALLAMTPFALLVIVWSLLRGDSPWQLRLGVRCPCRRRRDATETFAYYELTGARNWLRRWPQFWSVVRGDLTWVGNRPLRPTQALNLSNDFERLWLTAPVGLISLADAHGCPDGFSADACAHASYYAVNAGWRLNSFILSRALLRAAMAWPIWGSRRREAAVPLHELVPKQEI